MPIGQDDINFLRTHLNTNYNTSGTPWNFENGDFLDWFLNSGQQDFGPSNTGQLQGFLMGGMNAAGWSPEDLSVGLTGGREYADDITQIQGTYTPEQLNYMSRTAAQSLGWLPTGNGVGTFADFVSDNANPWEYDGSDVGDGTAWVGGNPNQGGGLQFNPLEPSPLDTNNSSGGGGNLSPQQIAARRANAGPFRDRSSRGGGPGAFGMNTGTATSGMPTNPYLPGIADSITQRLNENYERMLMPIADQAIGAGGLGGSRQGVAQGIAMEGTQDALASALSGLYGDAWNQDANRDLSRYGIDTSRDLQQQSINNAFTLGQGQLDLGNQNSWMGYDLGNQQNWLNTIGLGSQLMNQSTALPWYGFNQFGNLLGTAAGNNSNVTNSTSSGGGWQGMLGGALAGGSLANRFGWGF